MTLIGIILLIVAALVAFKVTAFLVRLVLIGVALFALLLMVASAGQIIGSIDRLNRILDLKAGDVDNICQAGHCAANT